MEKEAVETLPVRKKRNVKRPCKGTKRNGEPCSKSALKGRDYCASHGGKTLKGTEHPNYKHGARSKFNGSKLLQKFEERMKDHEVQDLNRHIRLANAMLDVVLEDLDSEGLTDIWVRLIKYWADFEFYQARASKGNVDAQERASENLFRVGETIKKGSQEYEKRNEIMKINNHTARLIESESKRMEKLNKMWPVDQVMMLVAQIAQAAKEIITSNDEKLRFADALKELIER